MNTTIKQLLLILIITAVQLSGSAQIKVVDDNYQPALGYLEEITLEDVPPELEFDFSVGDTVYVLESSHKFLSFNKKNHTASIKPFKTGFYVITGICFGDSIHLLHNMIDQYQFNKEYDRQEAHAIIYGLKIDNKRHEIDLEKISRCKKRDKLERCLDWELYEGFPLCGDTTGGRGAGDGRSVLSRLLVSFYQNDVSKLFIQKMRDWTTTSASSNDFIVGTAYRFENDNGDAFYVDSREIAFYGKEKTSASSRFGELNNLFSFYFSKSRGFDEYLMICNAYQIIVIKTPEFNRIRKDLVGKDFYFIDTWQLNNTGAKISEDMLTVDYISQKEIRIKKATGRMLLDAKKDRLNGKYDETKDLEGINNYYYCKDLFFRKGKLVVVFSNNLGEFTALLEERKNKNDYCSQSNIYSQYYFDNLDIVPKELIDQRIHEKQTTDQLAENERIEQEKQKKKQEQLAKQEIIAQQKKHNAEIIAKFGEKYGNMILQNKVAIGMNKEMCRAAGWYPRDTYKTTTSNGVNEIWVINYKTLLYFDNGILYMIQN